MKFKIIRTDRSAIEVGLGDIVYQSAKYDYGLANDDTRETGIEHVSVTFDQEGGYPFFTIPLEDLERIK